MYQAKLVLLYGALWAKFQPDVPNSFVLIRRRRVFTVLHMQTATHRFHVEGLEVYTKNYYKITKIVRALISREECLHESM